MSSIDICTLIIFSIGIGKIENRESVLIKTFVTPV